MKLNISAVQAHCDIPCKIYDPSTAQYAALSVIRLLDLINELPEALNTAQQAQLTRLVDQKETHSAEVKQLINTIWGDYFKQPQITAFPEIHELVHSVMQQASKCKQGINRDDGEQLLISVNRFADIFWQTKGISTKTMVAPYPPALPIVQPVLDEA
tara:strand:+ start:469 stop:939 length:471 start_codon:yes stop_codon:yes gene_type:complete